MLPAFNIDPTGADAKCGIYALRRVDKPEVYIGQSTDLRERLYRHHKHLSQGKHRNARLQNVYDRHGDVFTDEILAVGFDPTDKELLTLAEQEFMDAVSEGGLLNLAPAAGSTAGVRYSKEYCRFMSEARKGKPRTSYTVTEAVRLGRVAAGLKRRGQPRPASYPATSEAIVAGRLACGLKKRGQPSPWKGQTHTAETRAHISEVRQAQISAGMASGFKGRHHTEESRAKLSALKKGRPSPNRGITRTAEANAKQFEAMKRLYADPAYIERRKQIAGAQIGVKASPEIRAKLSESQKAAWARRKAAMETK